MRLGRTLILVALLLVVVLGVIFVATQFLGGGGGEAEATATPVMVEVVALAARVEAGDRLAAGDLQLIEVTEAEVQAAEGDLFLANDIDLVVGLYIKTTPTFDSENLQVLRRSMTTNNLQDLYGDLHSVHAELIPTGMVAFPIPISRFSGVAYGISQGDRINLIATLAFVDIDLQFQTALPNYMAGVLSPGYAMLMTTNPEHIAPDLSPEEQTYFSSQSIFNTQGNTLPWVNLVAQPVSGDYVSVQGRAEQDTLLEQPTYLVPGEVAQRPRFVSQTVVYNRMVLHVGSFPIPGQEEAEAAAQAAAAQAEAQAEAEGDGQGQQQAPPVTIKPPDVVTLVVSPQEAVMLNYLLYTGAELTIALRPPGDDNVIPTDAVSLQYLLDVYRIPVPVRLPYGMQPPMYDLVQPTFLNDVEATPAP